MARRSLQPAALAPCLALAFGLVSLIPLAASFEHRASLNLLFAVRGPLSPPPGAIVVAIDTATVSWLREIGASGGHDLPALAGCSAPEKLDALVQLRGPAGLPRWLQACLLTRLQQLGVPVVVFDVLFSVPGDPRDDALLAAALRAQRRSVILVGFGRSTVDAAGTEIVVDRRIPPVPAFEASAAATGAFLLPRTNGPAFGYWRKLPGFGATGSLPDEAFRLSRVSAPAPSGAADNFNYLWHYGPAGSIPTISMRDILSGEIDAPLRDALSGSVAFVGASDPRTTTYADSFPSYFSSRITSEISGVEIAATAFLNLSAGHRLHALPPLAEAGIVTAFLFVLSALALSRSRLGAVAAAACALIYLAACFLMFDRSRLILPVTIPVFIGGPVVLFVTVLMSYRLARALTMRLAPAPIARRMLSRAAGQRGAAESENATIVFCDIIGSTLIAETLSELEFSALLNAYYETVSREVDRCRGFVSSFAGDGVLAVFSESTARGEHPANACRAMVGAVREIRSLNLAHGGRGLPPLKLRIGINSGRVAEGDIGAKDRFNFSVVGDVVNLASRLEQMGKTLFPGEADVILVGAAARGMISGAEFAWLDCGMQVIPGRKSAERVFRIMPG